MFSRQQYLLILISMVTTWAAANNVCSDDKVYSDIRMMGSSQSPQWEVLDDNTGLAQLYYNISPQLNENAPLSYRDEETWTLGLYQIDNQALTRDDIQNCFNYTEHTNAHTPLTNGTSYPNQCKLEVKTNRETTFIISQNCPKCQIKGKLHSVVHYKMCRLDSCKEVKWLFSYVYSGWYVLLADKKSVSAPFWLESNYIKQNIMKSLTFKPPYQINDTIVATTLYGEALKNDCNNPMINYSCLEIKVYDQIIKIYYHKTEDKSKYCNKENGNVSVTEVHWNNADLSLYFKLNGLPAGINIRLMLRVIDTRCRRPSVWLWDKKGDTCVWRSTPFNITSYDEDTSHVQVPDTAKVQLVDGLIATIVILLAIVVMIMGFLGYKRFRNRSAIQPLSPRRYSVHLADVPQPPSSIFLLYARDCDLFMEAMGQFRQLLQRTTNAKIYDIWDEGWRDELYAEGDTWALNYLMSENTQVIVVVTPVSRRIEKLILKNDWSTNESLYNEPNALDEIFVSAFKASICLTNTHPARCRKFIVVRMSSIGCCENLLTSFKSLCTIYTLPSLIDSLFRHLFDGHWEPQKLAASIRLPFENKIKELEEYIKRNPAYEEEMVPTVLDNNGHSPKFEVMS